MSAPLLRPVLFLLSDFGWRDPYVGALKASFVAALTEARVTPIIDLCHDVAPHNIRHGAWILAYALKTLPRGAVTLAVVDPGVGDPEQDGLIVYWPQRQQAFIAPDNGLLTPVLNAAGSDARIAAVFSKDIPDNAPACKTFYGRDRYAPAAAHLTQALFDSELDAFWRDRTRPLRRPPQLLPPGQTPQRAQNSDLGPTLSGTIDHSDRFGNLLSDIPAGWLTPGKTAVVSGKNVSYPALCVSHYAQLADANSDTIGIIASSHHTLEFCCFEASAAERLQLRIGDPATITL
ncbi:MAG: SAM-dependent chlorinase/fluorinase [Vampirovibrionales bacterium]|nr:SAM-dependent chlorinase/fluorinase [Vampirovibrionales bacterium]